jgi:hypothetical protein
LNGNLQEAKKSLALAESLIAAPRSLDRLYTNRCRAFLTALETRSIEPLLDFRNEAFAWPHAETVRETDLYTLMINPSEKLHEQLYFGTPFKFYRERMARLLGGSEPKKSHLVYGDPEGPCIDIVTGTLNGQSSGTLHLKPGSSVHKVISALLRDFYRPVRFGSLFGQLFPGEHFDIHSSPARVHQCLRRARKWLSEHELPASIIEESGAYTLQLNGPLSFRLPVDRDDVNRNNGLLVTLSEAYPNGETFTASDACKKLHLTNSAFHRFLRPMLEAREVEKFGASTSTIYYIPAERLRASS